MDRLEEIQKMFEEMGLGTEEDREKYLLEEEKVDTHEQIFIRLGTNTIPLEGKEDA